MAPRLILNTISFILFLTCSCCKSTDNKKILPIWDISLPTGTAREIFYDGLCDLPVFNNWIIAHTTVGDNGVFQEDNRLCAVNTQTKQVDWFFPDKIQEYKSCFFNGRSYLYENKLVFRFESDTRIEPERTTVCFDLLKQEILWSQKEESKEPNGNNSHVIGENGISYFVQNDRDLCSLDCRFLNFSILWQSDTLQINNTILSSDKNHLCIFAFYPFKNGDEYLFKNYVFIYDIKSSQIIYKKQILPPEQSYSNHFYASGIEQDGILIISVDRYLTILDWRNDKQLWEKEDPVDVESYNKQDYYVYHNTIMTCCVNAILGYKLENGEIQYYHNNHGAQYATFDGPYAYVVRMSGNLEIIDVETGNILCSILPPESSGTRQKFFGSYPTLYENNMYIMGGNNKLYCYPKYPW